MLSKIVIMPLIVSSVVEGFSKQDTWQSDHTNASYQSDCSGDCGKKTCRSGYHAHDDTCKFDVLETTGWDRRLCWEERELQEGEACVVTEQCKYGKATDPHYYWSCDGGHVCGVCHGFPIPVIDPHPDCPYFDPPIVGQCVRKAH